MPQSETYKRGQVEWALWRFTSFWGSTAPTKPPKAFLTRVKRLLEIDRADRHGKEQPLAFSETPSEGQGIDVAFTAFDAFCLALALDLLDAGFKQSEVVYLMRHIREKLRNEYEWVMANPPPVRQRVAATDAPDRPSYTEGVLRWADFRVFAVIQKVEMTEVFPLLSQRADPKAPVFLEPVFCRGIEAMQSELNNMPYEYRKTMVLEIAYAAALVTESLKVAPVTKRGRG